MTEKDSEATGVIAGSTVALGELAQNGIKFLGKTGATTLLEEGAVEEAGSALAVLGGPVTLTALALGGGLYAYDRYSGGKVTNFFRNNLGIGEGCN